MKLYSTNGVSPEVGLEEAIFLGLPSDNGLFMPKEFKALPQNFWDTISTLSFQEIAFEVANALIGEDIAEEELRNLINEAINFDAPVVEIEENTYCLELFHGPSMAFKDFGARFMASLMSYFLKKNDRQINILVATSGDTGGAVAQGFFKTPNINVTILYPKGKVSEIQEKQLTTLGHNVKALEIDGTFDDCQSLVKSAFLDQDLRSKFSLASANSINISRLIPQAFYYVYAYSKLQHLGLPVVFSVPSGNFGNLSAGLIALKLGMPVAKFIAATNINKVVPTYLETEKFTPISPSLSTISNAMDVGNPSNFPRMKALLDNDFSKFREKVFGAYYSDEQTEFCMKEVYQKSNYVMCPHTAIAYLGLKEYREKFGSDTIGVFLSTAHFAKFLPDVERVIGVKLDIPERLSDLLSKEKAALEMKVDYNEFKKYLEKELV